MDCCVCFVCLWILVWCVCVVCWVEYEVVIWYVVFV